jgi:hypothetical protein
VLTCGGIGAGGRPRRRPPAAAAGGVTPASWQLGLANKREGDLQGVLGHAEAARVSGASGRRVELAVSTDGGGNGGLVALQRA